MSEVKFTGLTVPASHLTKDAAYGGRLLLRGPVPPSWTRYQVVASNFENNVVRGVDQFIFENLTGRWARYTNVMTGHLVLFFEDAVEAVMFRFHGDRPFEKRHE